MFGYLFIHKLLQEAWITHRASPTTSSRMSLEHGVFDHLM